MTADISAPQFAGLDRILGFGRGWWLIEPRRCDRSRPTAPEGPIDDRVDGRVGPDQLASEQVDARQGDILCRARRQLGHVDTLDEGVEVEAVGDGVDVEAVDEGVEVEAVGDGVDVEAVDEGVEVEAGWRWR